MDDQNTNSTINPVQAQVADAILNQDIIKLLKLDNLPVEEQEALRQKMIDTIEQRVMARLMDSLNAEDKKKLDELLNQNNAEETQKFLDGKINVKEVAAQETLQYKMEMIDNAQRIDEMVKNPASSQDTNQTAASTDTTTV